MSSRITGPHQRQPVLTSGAPVENAKAAMIMVHGRGGTAKDILSLLPLLNQPEFAYLAPQASENSWYPDPFLAPIQQNEPGISSGLQVIKDLLDELNGKGIGLEKVILLGFSQGGCLTLEFAARNARKYGGVIGLSAGLIGPENTPRDYSGALDGTPVFLGCSDPDPHIPTQRVHETTRVFQELGGTVTERLYKNLGHTINEDEIGFVQNLMRDLVND